MIDSIKASAGTLAAVVPLLVSLATSIAVEASDAREPLSGRFPVTLEYNRELKGQDKLGSIRSTVAILRDLGIDIAYEPAAVAQAVAASGGRISATAVSDPHLLYDALYYVTDVARLPAGLYPLFGRILIVEKLRIVDPRTGKLRSLPLGIEPGTATIVVDHRHLNQLEFFGNFVHPKVNWAMLLELAIEARLVRMGPEVLREVGLDIVVDDEEWAQLNSNGWHAYNGEDIAFVGLKTAARVTPPGILYDAVRELRSGVPANAYAGLPDASQPWWSPRHGPASDRQSILRSLFSRSPTFFQRVGGQDMREDRVLREKTRLILYAAFVASGGILDHGFWVRRHHGSEIVDELTRDFTPEFLESLQDRLDANEATRDIRLRPAS